MIKTVAKNGKIGIQGQNLLGAALARTVRFVIWAGSVMSRKEVQTSTAKSIGEKKDSLEAWAGKAVESVPSSFSHENGVLFVETVR